MTVLTHWKQKRDNRAGFGRSQLIKNERQYQITKAQVSRFVRTLEGLNEEVGVNPHILKAQKEAVCSQLTELKAELDLYEVLKAGQRA